MLLKITEIPVGEELIYNLPPTHNIEIASYGTAKNNIHIELNRIISSKTLSVSICKHQLSLYDIIVHFTLDGNTISLNSYEVSVLDPVKHNFKLKCIGMHKLYLYLNNDISIVRSIAHTCIYSSTLFKDPDIDLMMLYEALDCILDEFITLRKHLMLKETNG